PRRRASRRARREWPRAPPRPSVPGGELPSSHRPQREKIRQAVHGLTLHALRLSWTAHGTEVAPGAGAIGRRGDEKTLFDGAIDDRQRLDALRACVIGDRNGVFGETAGGRAVVQASLDDFLAEPLLDRRAVEHRLEHCPGADDEVAIRAVLA